MPAPRKYSDELRQRAVRMVLQIQRESGDRPRPGPERRPNRAGTQMISLQEAGYTSIRVSDSNVPSSLRSIKPGRYVAGEDGVGQRSRFL
jgi:hypothetical protein